MTELARSFGDIAEAYERGRPRYPADVIEGIAAAAGGGPRLLDVGAGTGRLSGPLVQAGYDVVSVEPLDAMRAILTRAIGHERALAGHAEDLPLDDASVDGAVCSDAWHWFDGARAADELHRVVRPGGGVAVCVLMLDDDQPRPVWGDEIEAVMTKLWDAVDHPSRGGPKRADGLDGHPGFEAIEVRHLPFVYRTDRERMLDHFLSMSAIASLDAEGRAQALGALDAIFERHGVDAVEVAYRAELFITRRLPDPAPPGDRPAAAS
jgi:SAM-dependent methyltransferase